MKLWHFIFWFCYLVILAIISALYDGLWKGAFLMNILRVPLIAICTYIIFYTILKKEKLAIYIKVLFSVICILATGLLIRLNFSIFVFPYYFDQDYTFTFFNWYRIASQYLVIATGIGAFGTFQYLLDKRNWDQRKKLLISEKKQAELNFYKAQIHPHFLFNTLNGIYNEVLKKSDDAAEMLLKVSDILRFMLYECQNRFMPLSKEIELIDNYISLEQMRYGKRLKIKFDIKGKENTSKNISPLTLFAFVENSFKHGVSAQKADSYVFITLNAEDKFLIFKIRNSKFEFQKDETGYAKGIGLDNIRSQLNLIYENDYVLQQEDNANEFTTYLKIPYLNG